MSCRLRYLGFVALSFAICGCGESNVPGGNSNQSATAAVFNPTGAPTVEFSLPDMMCEDGCAMTVQDILERQPGAKDVRVDFDGKSASVAIDDDEFDANLAIEDLVDKGFVKSALADSGTAEKLHTEDSPSHVVEPASPSG